MLCQRAQVFIETRADDRNGLIRVGWAQLVARERVIDVMADHGILGLLQYIVIERIYFTFAPAQVIQALQMFKIVDDGESRAGGRRFVTARAVVGAGRWSGLGEYAAGAGSHQRGEKKDPGDRFHGYRIGRPEKGQGRSGK